MAMALTALATPAVLALARRAGAVDHPGPRRIHAAATPTLGGLAIAFAVLATLWTAFLLPGPARQLSLRPLLGLTLAAVPLLALGIVDDLRGVRAPIKLAVQAAAGLVLAAWGYGVPLLTNPFGGELHTGWLDAPLTILWVVIVINAINLIDGLDGLAAGVVLIASMTLWWVGRTHADSYVMFFAAPLAGAMLAFLRWNFPPARVFMGDTGSHFLGLALAAISLLENRKGTATVTLLLPLVALGVPIADGVLAFLRRALRGRPVFRPDTEHLHHRLLRLGLSPRRALFVLWYVSLYFGILAVVLAALPRHYGWLLLALLAMGLFFAFEALEFVDRRRPPAPPEAAREGAPEAKGPETREPASRS